MVGTEFQRKLLYNVRPTSEPCLILKSNLQYRRTSQYCGNQSKPSMYTQAARLTDVTPVKSNSPLRKAATGKIHCSQSSLYIKPGPRGTSSQITQSTNFATRQNNTATYSHLNSGPKHCQKLANNVISYGRCLSAPARRTLNYKIRQESTPLGETTRSRSTRTKQRCLSAPKPSLSNGPRIASTVCGNSTKAISPIKHHGSAKKFSSSLLCKSQSELDNEAMSDVISFTDDLIDGQLDAYSCRSDDSSIVDVKWRPRSCISFRRTVCSAEQLVPNSRHHCVTYLKNRPHSSPNPRQRVKPKLSESHFRRGNVPKYISFVEPMPMHERPGTGKSSGYESCGISVVSEDLLVSAGTREELADSGEESGSELDIGYRGVLLRDGLAPRTVDIDDVSQEAMFSSRSSFNKSELDGSFLGAEGSNMDEQEADSDMVSGVGQDGLDSVGRPGQEDVTNGDDNQKEGLPDDSFNIDENAKDIDEGDFDAGVLGPGTNVDDQSESVDGKNSALGTSGEMGDEYNRDSSWLPDFEQQTPAEEENTFDVIDNETPTALSDSSDSNPQVTFSEPLATDRRLSTNVTEDAEPLKSILKTDSDKNTIYEHELDPSIMRRLTSPSEETDKTSTKPVMERRSADLRPQSKPDILLREQQSRAQSRIKQATVQNTEQDSSDDDGSDSDLYSSTGAERRRRQKPKNNIYGKRANMKARGQKVRRKKESNENADEDDLIMSAESALLMEQILEEEKRLKEGMKPWLKGRLALSQQNSRFEIPMDVRLLETMTPMEYLTRYCIISKRRKALYQHVFQKVDRNRDGIINFQELETGLKDVHTGILDSEHVGNIVKMVHIDKEGSFDLKQFSAIAAFSERISCKYQLPAELLNSFEGQKEVIECADFFALNWKLDGIKVNPDVRRILDSL